MWPGPRGRGVGGSFHTIHCLPFSNHIDVALFTKTKTGFNFLSKHAFSFEGNGSRGRDAKILRIAGRAAIGGHLPPRGPGARTLKMRRRQAPPASSSLCPRNPGPSLAAPVPRASKFPFLAYFSTFRTSMGHKQQRLSNTHYRQRTSHPLFF